MEDIKSTPKEERPGLRGEMLTVGLKPTGGWKKLRTLKRGPEMAVLGRHLIWRKEVTWKGGIPRGLDGEEKEGSKQWKRRLL